MPAAILFDLDDTILSFGSRQQSLTLVAEKYKAELGSMTPEKAGCEIERAFVEFWADEVRHKAWRFNLLDSRILIVSEIFAAWREFAPALTPEVAKEFATEFSNHRDAQARFFPGALETIDELRRRNVRLALVTNGAADVQRKKVEGFDLAHRFDLIQIEGEMGFGKPESRAYTYAMTTLGVEPHETWMVGDNLEWEVAAPQRHGIKGIWNDHLSRGLPPESPYKPDRIIRQISELLA